MEHDGELIIPILEILEIEVCNILYNPGNIGNGCFSFLISWKYWKTYFFNFLISWKYWIVRSILSPILEILDRTIHICSYVDVAGGRGGSGDGGGGDVPTTLPSGQSPGPSRPGIKYPVRGQSLTSMI